MGKYHKSHYVNEWLRYVLYGFNFILWLLGIFIIIVGIIGIAIREDKLDINSYINFFTDPAAVLVAIGAIIFVVTFFGCVGALNENCFFLRIYFILLIIVFVVEILCGIFAFAFSTELEEKIDNVIKDGIRQYRENEDLTNFIDFAQRELECCGGKNNYFDWSYNRYFNCTDSGRVPSLGVEQCGVPYSCCKGSDDEAVIINTQCGFDVQRKTETTATDVIYVSGCIAKFKATVETRSLLIGGSVFSVAALQLIGIILAFELNRELVAEKKRFTGHSDLPK